MFKSFCKVVKRHIVCTRASQHRFMCIGVLLSLNNKVKWKKVFFLHRINSFFLKQTFWISVKIVWFRFRSYNWTEVVSSLSGRNSCLSSARSSAERGTWPTQFVYYHCFITGCMCCTEISRPLELCWHL